MTTTQTAGVALPSFDKLKMEERKRSLLPDGDDGAPRAKRLVKDENGQAMRMDNEKEKEIESFQKDAILRQLKEYKRQKRDLDEQLSEMTKKCRYHDDHLRAVDGFFAQLLDEIRVLASTSLPTPPPSATAPTGEEMYGSALLFENSHVFSEHLQARSQSIRSAIADLFGRLPSATPDVESLRAQLNELLAKEKEHAVQLRKALDDQESLTQRWEAAVERYMMAEKKLDRAKSQQVLKLERQAIMGGNADVTSPTTSKASGTPVKKEHSAVNGELENGLLSAEAEAARKEALAVAERQKAQVEEVEAENERLTNELSAARTKLASLSDDDYAETSIFKTFKSQYEDVVRRVNDLEATNVQLREEAQKLQSERTSYRRQIDDENREHSNDSEAQIARAETDLARIRQARDDVTAEVEVRRRAEESRRSANDLVKELAEAKDMKIAALEAEIARLKTQVEDSVGADQDIAGVDNTDLESLDNEALKLRLRTLEGQHALLSNELSSMEAAWRKTSALATQKVAETANQEELVARLNAEKAKADQKYFAAMKSNDMKQGELRSLKMQNAKSSEIVTQLKESEGKARELVSNLERQIAESKDALAKLEQQHRTLEQKNKESAMGLEGSRKQIGEFKTLISAKDKEILAAGKAKRDAEAELERTQTRLEDSRKQVESLRKTRAAENSATSDEWRKVAICPVCNTNLRNTTLKLCGHVFCGECVQRLIANRNRKCPSCARAFGNGDFMGIVLT
ncbi:hypothetical protein BAUCODRAFT_106504 [Baudoinia panamericana UAMH 10762]|uniref:E3 ubiquitin protein ligase n=1 Tax=Baudoinia panamericana (strain UAMH 10762) TaxID=717646 RepID=M2ND75_BAUPA|nr:uncharacterized protein BAUCODRAFT_106504 [Baudoinia panamericana UAMH 10762]EMC97159.1 hypothetical protein BAUCODRAFT_106504 [Baudoinia panamericana UAMH 10762]